jgi:hypothetical protein
MLTTGVKNWTTDVKNWATCCPRFRPVLECSGLLRARSSAGPHVFLSHDMLESRTERA